MKPVCVYCKASGVAFDREHVIPAAFGRFDGGNLVLHDTVCHDCNHYFSRELEQHFNRGSYEAVQRFKLGLKEPSRGHELRSDRVEFLVPDGPFKGARLYMGSNPDGRPCMRWHPQAGFKLLDGPGRRFFLLRELERMKSFDRSPFVLKHESAVVIVVYSDEEERRLLEQFARLQITFTKRSEVERSRQSPMNVEVTGIFDKISARTIAKIAFNYMAAVLGRERCLNPDFDPVRVFIRNGIDLDYPVVSRSKKPILASDSRHWRQTDGHLVVLEAINNWRTIQAKVSLFNTFTYEILLCRQRSGSLLWPVNSGHHFNVRDKSVSPLTRWSQPIGLLLTTPRFASGK